MLICTDAHSEQTPKQICFKEREQTHLQAVEILSANMVHFHPSAFVDLLGINKKKYRLEWLEEEKHSNLRDVGFGKKYKV